MSLRSLTEVDLPTVLKWRNAPDVRRSMYSSHIISEEEHRAWYSRMSDDHQSRWYIHADSLGVSDGVVYFTQYSPIQRSAFWGFYTGLSAKRGAGTDIGIEAIDLAFQALNLHKLNAEVLVTNERSVRFHLKLGFTQEGCFRDAHFDGEKYVAVLRFALLEYEWSEKRGSLILGASKRDGNPVNLDGCS